MKTFIEDFMIGSRRSPYPKGASRAPGSMAGRVGDTALLVDLTDEVYLAGIHTLRSKTGRGSASRALRWLCHLADKHGFVVYLFAKATEHQTLTTKQLRGWYGRNGFVASGKWMVRRPKQKGTYATRRARPQAIGAYTSKERDKYGACSAAVLAGADQRRISTREKARGHGIGARMGNAARGA